MSEPFVGEIKFYAFDFPPRGWAVCDGRVLPIASNQALFALLGTTFGGNGINNFALPDLRGRVPMHPGNGIGQGTKAGVENVTLIESQIPTHSHSIAVSSTTSGSVEGFTDSVIALGAVGTEPANVYAPADAGPLLTLKAGTVGPTGDTQPHPNCQPSLVGNYCIALNGVFPSHP